MFSLQLWQLLARQQQLERAALAWRPPDESQPLQAQDHLMDRRRRNLEIALHVSFRRRAPVDLRVIVDEGEVLPLLGGIGCLRCHCDVRLRVAPSAAGRLHAQHRPPVRSKCRAQFGQRSRMNASIAALDAEFWLRSRHRVSKLPAHSIGMSTDHSRNSVLDSCS